MDTRYRAALIVCALAAQCLQATAGPVIDKIKQRNSITLGHRPASPPFSYISDGGEVVGYSIDICKHIVNDIKSELGLPNLEIKYAPVDPANRIPLIQNGTLDLECATTGNTPARATMVGFSLSIIFLDTRIMVFDSSLIRSVSDLKGRPVSVMQGTIQQGMLADIDRKFSLGVRAVQAKDAAEAFLAFRTQRAEATINDPILLSTYVMKMSPPVPVRFLPDWAGIPEAAAILFDKDDNDLRQLVNASIRKMMNSGAFIDNYNKWLASPPYSIPANDALLQQIKSPTDTSVSH